MVLTYKEYYEITIKAMQNYKAAVEEALIYTQNEYEKIFSLETKQHTEAQASAEPSQTASTNPQPKSNKEKQNDK